MKKYKSNYITPITALLALLCLMMPFVNIGEKYVINTSEKISGLNFLFGNYDVTEYSGLFKTLDTWTILLKVIILLSVVILIAIGVMTLMKRSKFTNVLALVGSMINLLLLTVAPIFIKSIGTVQTDKIKGIVTFSAWDTGYTLYVVVNLLIAVVSIILLTNEKGSNADIAFTITNTIILTIFVVVTLYPLMNMLAISFNDGLDAQRGGIYLIPRKFSLNNYRTVLKMDSMMQGTIISVLRTVIGTLLSLFTTAMLAYVVSKKDFVFKKQVSLLYVLTMYVSGGLIPGFLLLKSYGLTNSFWVYIIPGMVSAFNMIVIRTYMHGIPDSLSESAEVDGAGHMRIFLRIILPLCKPVLATMALFIAVNHWNSWFDAMLYNQFDPKLTTLQYELMKLLSSVSSQSQSASTMKNAANMITPGSIRAAATIITALPIVCLYPFLQRYFVSGLTIGGVKE